MTRPEEIAHNLARVRERIDQAASSSGRAGADITLIVVTKTYPVRDVRTLYELGVRNVGENKHQEALGKRAEASDLSDLRWHFIGGLQSNKAAAVGAYADVVHSVDRPSLLRPLARAAEQRGRSLDVLLQVSLDPNPSRSGPGHRSGCPPAGLLELADQVSHYPDLRVLGLMAVAPLAGSKESAFGRLAQIRSQFLAVHPEASWLSAGMSNDMEEAIAVGATHVRLGAAVLGSRPSLK